jgi:hypothetical protein
MPCSLTRGSLRRGWEHGGTVKGVQKARKLSCVKIYTLHEITCSAFNSVARLTFLWRRLALRVAETKWSNDSFGPMKTATMFVTTTSTAAKALSLGTYFGVFHQYFGAHHLSQNLTQL